MDIETILSATIMADRRRMISPHKYYPHSERQYHAFRDRILRMYNERDEQAARSFELWTIERGIAKDLRKQMAEKDAEIAKLLELAQLLDSHRKTRLNNEYLDSMDMAKMIMQRER